MTPLKKAQSATTEPGSWTMLMLWMLVSLSIVLTTNATELAYTGWEIINILIKNIELLSVTDIVNLRCLSYI